MIFWRVVTEEYVANRKPISFKQINKVCIQEQKAEERNKSGLHSSTQQKREYTTEADAEIKTAFKAKIKRVFENQNTVLRVCVEGAHMQYTPGDSVLLRVSNSKERTDWLMEELNIDREKSIAFKRVHIKSQNVVFSYKGKIKEYFRHFLDISSLPSKYMLYKLSMFAEEEKRDRLLYLASKEGSKDYFLLSKSWNDLCDIIQQFKVQVDLETLLEVCTEIRPRAFSLTQQQNKDAEFICKIINKKTGEDTRYGHFSSYAMRQIERAPGSGFESDIIYGIQRKPNKLMQMKEGNGILVGVGTGVAPFISFLAQREKRSFILFHGCATKKECILHALNIIHMEEKACEYKEAKRFTTKDGSTLYSVYSRENASIRMDKFFSKNTEQIANLIATHQKVYICGNKGVQKSLRQHFTSSHPQAEVFIDDWS